MKRCLSVALMASAVAFAPAASAADIFPEPNAANPPNSSFEVSGNPFTGTEPVSATIGNAGLDGTDFDRFIFRIGPIVADPGQIGLGSGSVNTVLSGVLNGTTDLDFGEITFFNGFSTFSVTPTVGASETGFLFNVPIFSGVENILTVNYTARGEGSYGGVLNFVPTAPIPEPMTWLLMLVGFGAVGLVMRRRPKQEVRVRYAH